MKDRDTKHMTLGQIEFGNNIIDLVEESVKLVGWDKAAQAAMTSNMMASKEMGELMPRQGKVGETFTITEEFHAAYQEWIGSISLMAAVVANRRGVDLKIDAKGTC